MRVLLCNNFFYRRGGDCTHMFALADLLKQRGHDVFFFSMEHPKNLPCDQSGYFIDYIDYAALNKRHTLQNAMKVLRRSIYFDQSRERLEGLIRDLKPDVAHLHNIHAYLTPSILDAFARADIPVVWTLHDYKLICPESTLLSAGNVCEACKGGRFFQCTLHKCKKGSRGASFVASLEAYVHRAQGIGDKVSAFISPSRFLRDKFIEFGWDGSRIQFVRNFLPSWPEAENRQGSHGIYSGTLLPTKGVATLVQALAKTPEHAFHILGDGEERESLESEAQRLGLSQVQFRGFLKGEAWERALADAQYGVMPSTWYENCPYAAMELMARGKPLIASRIGGLPELIEDGESGLLFNPGDEEDLAEKIGRLRSDPSLVDRMGEKARAFARSEFGADAYYTKIQQIYEDVTR